MPPAPSSRRGARGPRGGKQRLEIVRKRLGHALRVLHAHRQRGGVESRQARAHGHAVIVISANARRAPAARQRRGRDADEIGSLLHRRAQLAQLGRHGGNAVGFLHAPARNVAQRAGAIGIQRHHGQRHRRIGNVVAVQINRLQRPGPAPCAQPAAAALHVRAHQAGRLHKANVALHRIQPQPFDHKTLAALRRRQRPRRNEITGRRRIRFHQHFTRRLIAAAFGNDKTLPPLPLHRHAKALQQRQRDVDVRPRNQLALHLHRHLALTRGQRQRQQQRRQKLAGNIAAHPHRRIQRQRRHARRFGNAQRRKTRPPQLLNAAPQPPQRRHQIANGPLVHARHARQLMLAAQQRQRRRQRPHRRARIAQKKPRGRRRRAPAQPLNQHLIGPAIGAAHAAAHLRQRLQHHPRVVAIEQAAHPRRALAQGRQQQHAVGNALGARQPHPPLHGAQGGDIQKFSGEHGFRAGAGRYALAGSRLFSIQKKEQIQGA